MTSKEQELKTLEKIKELVAGLGEDSYIGFAFEGCFEMAEKDAEDWRKVAHQNRDKADTMLGKYAELGEKHNEMVAKNIELQKVIDEKDGEIVKLKAKLYDLLVAQDAR